MRAPALSADFCLAQAERFERRLRVALMVAFLSLAAVLIGLGLWLERPWASSNVGQVSSAIPGGEGFKLTMEVSR